PQEPRRREACVDGALPPRALFVLGVLVCVARTRRARSCDPARARMECRAPAADSARAPPDSGGPSCIRPRIDAADHEADADSHALRICTVDGVELRIPNPV